jgi:HD-like signal output (HDOD) protein/DNA-binding response OmpR family regulator
MSTILIVDAQAAMREPIEAALRRAGHRALGAANGKHALEQFKLNRPELIVLDMAVPELDGLTLLQMIRTMPGGKSVAAIILTAVTDKDKIMGAARLGVKAYLLKSRFSMTELLNLVSKHAGQPTANSGAIASGSAPSAAPATHTASTANGTSAATLSGDMHRAPASSSFAPSTATTTPAASPPLVTVCAASTASPIVDQSEDVLVEALRSLKPVLVRSELQQQIDKCGELKGFSPVVAEVLKLTGNARCSIEHVARAISRDHAIALKILKLANSAVYTRGEPVDSVLKAVLRIGFGQIRQAVLNVAVIERFSGPGPDGKTCCIEPGQFWEHAIATGIMAAEIAHARNEKEADGAFTMGLLHDVGRMVLVDQLGETYRQVVDTAQRLQLPLDHVEHRMLCVTHADMMDRVLRMWKFPKNVVNPIVFHHLSAGNIRKTAPQETVQVATVGLANRLAHALMLGSSGNETIYPTEDHCELLKLDPSVVQRIEDIARDETDKMKFALLANSNMANWAQLRLVHRQALAQPLRPIYVSSSPQFDACRIFCDQLQDHSDGEVEGSSPSPNIGIIRLRHVRERVQLTAAYREKEAASGVANLPLLVISPAGKIMPELSLTNGRQVAALSAPFVVSRFIATVNSLLSVQPMRAAA